MKEWAKVTGPFDRQELAHDVRELARKHFTAFGKLHMPVSVFVTKNWGIYPIIATATAVVRKEEYATFLKASSEWLAPLLTTILVVESWHKPIRSSFDYAHRPSLDEKNRKECLLCQMEDLEHGRVHWIAMVERPQYGPVTLGEWQRMPIALWDREFSFLDVPNADAPRSPLPPKDRPS